MFVIGSVLWYVATAIAVIWMMVAVICARNISVALCLALYVAFLQYLAKVDVLGLVTSSPVHLLLLAFGYVLVGVTWSIPRWWLYIRKWAHTRHDFPSFPAPASGYNNDLTLTEYREKWFSRVSDDPYRWRKHLEEIIPKAAHKKDMIVCWMLWWPVSMFVCVFEDLLRELYRWCAENLRNVHDNIARKVVLSMEGKDA